MEINFAETKSIAEALPIGIYAKRRIRCSLREDEDTSYYSPMTDEIVISYPQISVALKITPETEDKEVAIRSMLYHEVSHAILTGYNGRVTDQFNIFEDERIETVLNDFYLDVDFSKQVYRINGIQSNDDLKAPKDAMDAFYQLVRFHKGDSDLLEEVKKMLIRFAPLSKKVNMTPSGDGWWDYNRAVNDLFNEVKRRMGEPPVSDEEEDNGEEGGSSSGDGTGSGSGSGSGKDGKSGSGKGKKKSKSGMTDGEGKKVAVNVKDAIKKALEASGVDLGDVGEKGNSLEKVFSDGVAPAYDDDLYKKFDVIISNFNKKNNSGASLTGYSGVFNPRSAGREDCRYFDRKATVNGTNKFGTFHLNLFLDNSGSFCDNAPIVNAVLGALVRLEKVNRNFSFDVVHCGVGEELITDKSKCGLTCDDGTVLDYDAIELYRKLQKPSTYNYNIVLYDGSCYDRRYADAFKAFNYNNTTIISDISNRDEIERYAPNAKQIITKRYTENLLDNIVDTLSRAFR